MPLTARFAVRPWFDTQNFFQTPGEIGLALALPDKVVLRLEAELIPKLVSLKGVSAWMDGIGPPMLITLQS